MRIPAETIDNRLVPQLEFVAFIRCESPIEYLRFNMNFPGFAVHIRYEQKTAFDRRQRLMRIIRDGFLRQGDGTFLRELRPPARTAGPPAAPGAD